MKRSYVSIALYLFLIFASGIVVGAFAFRLYSGTPVSAKSPTKLTPEEWRRQYAQEMETRVKLNPEQMEKLNAILDETRANAKQAHETCDGAIKQIRDEQVVKIRSILTDNQRTEYEQLRADREKRAKAAAKN